jgi:formate dehydrogenase major subunit
MGMSRREVIRLSLAGAGGAALGGLVASGMDIAPVIARARALRIARARTTPSICPFCSVGCATLIHTVDGQIVNIEGDPRSPHNEGTLCPKGAATFQLHVNPNRPTRVLHRAPGAADWEVWDLERAMDRVAQLLKEARDETFVETLQNGKAVRASVGVFSLGGATLDIEWNHIQQKLMRGLGIVSIENQARI